MSSYRGWMHRRLNPDGVSLTEEFMNGLNDFIDFAVNQPACMDGTKIRCPCKECKNLKFFQPTVVEYHLKLKGFSENYICWSSHGEVFMAERHGNQEYAETEIVFGAGAYEAGPSTYNAHTNINEVGMSTYDPFQTMVIDAYGHNFEYSANEPEIPNPEAQSFYDTMKMTEVPLFDGCDLSLLAGVSRLMSIKSEYNLPESCYDKISSVIKDMHPQSLLPDTFYETKKLDDLGLQRVTELDSDENNEWIQSKSDCGWKKRSIFWDLPYWSTNLIRHNLDVMHIEKNCFENVFNTVMDIQGKTKDNDKSRKDLPNICDRPELDLDENGVYPEAKYIIKKGGVRALCDWVRGLKFPDGYVSNMSRCIEMNKYRTSGMKSHDCHVFMQRLIPIAFKELLPESVWKALTEFSLFFKDLTCTTLRVDDMKRLEKEIPIILCKLEQIFPPSFFDSMEHLPVHLPYEARIAGPVQYRWMYPFERYLKHLKKTVGNRAKVEGSIGNAYLTEEFSNFGSLYFEPHVHTRHRKVRRNDDGGERAMIPGNLSIFTYPGRTTSKGLTRTLSQEEYKTARSYILQNCKEVEPYVPIFVKYLLDNSLAYTHDEISTKVDNEFPEWFENYAKTPSNIEDNEFIYALSLGPLRRVKSYPVYFVNGYKFHTLQYGCDKITANSGVCIKGFTDFSNQSSSSDYYGLLTDILELEYPRQPIKRTVLFKCQWFDPSPKGTKVNRRYNLVDINIKSKYPKYDPFILAMQAMQVCYVPYPRLSIKENNAMGERKKKTRKGDKEWWGVCKIKA